VTGQQECRPTDRSVPSCRHNGCDGKKSGLTCENAGCDGIRMGQECRHNPVRTQAATVEANRADDAVTGPVRSEWAEIRSPDDDLVVWVPTEVPVLTPHASRALFAILVGLAEVPALDRPAEEARDDR
jgi:hypothetical protein